jgi:MFS family permease
MAQANGSPATTDPHQNGEASQGQQSKGEATAEEPAPDDARYSNSYIYTCLIGYSLSFVIFGSQVSILGPTIQPLAERLSVAEADLSPLFTALGISCIVSGTPSGWLVDRVPTHHVLIGSLLVEVSERRLCFCQLQQNYVAAPMWAVLG